jgi:hypothetical protein
VPSLFYERLGRWNSPYINHFLSPDTIISDQTNPQNWNRYSYVNNNPLRYTDPTGHYACGDGEEHDCNGHKQDPSKNPHPPKPPKPNKEKDTGGAGKPKLMPVQNNAPSSLGGYCGGGPNAAYNVLDCGANITQDAALVHISVKSHTEIGPCRTVRGEKSAVVGIVL